MTQNQSVSKCLVLRHQQFKTKKIFNLQEWKAAYPYSQGWNLPLLALFSNIIDQIINQLLSD